MKNSGKAKRLATPEDAARLGRRMKWRDIRLPNDEVVTAETIGEIFAHAKAGLKSEAKRKRKPAYVAAS